MYLTFKDANNLRWRYSFSGGFIKLPADYSDANPGNFVAAAERPVSVANCAS